MDAIREWLRQTTRPLAYPSAGWMATVLVVVAFQTFWVARLVFAGHAGDGPGFNVTRTAAGAVGVTVGAIGVAALLAWCPRWPLTILTVQSVVFVGASVCALHNAVVFSLLVSLFAVLVGREAGSMGVASVFVVSAMTASSVLVAPGDVTRELLGQLVTAAVVALVAFAARSVTGWRRANRRAAVEARHAVEMEQERDRATWRAQVAAELHDSVGHDLTAIIALSEALAGQTGDDDLDESLTDINTLARHGLAETRHAVRALAAPAPTGSMDTPKSRHQWDEIRDIAETVRGLGVRVVVTESGRRPEGSRTADLAFTVVREAVTNAVRHTPDLAQVAVALDHAPLATTVTVRSGPLSSCTADVPDGTGLSRLRREVTAVGGTFTAGPDDPRERWTVHAALPIERPEIG